MASSNKDLHQEMRLEIVEIIRERKIYLGILS